MFVLHCFFVFTVAITHCTSICRKTPFFASHHRIPSSHPLHPPSRIDVWFCWCQQIPIWDSCCCPLITFHLSIRSELLIEMVAILLWAFVLGCFPAEVVSKRLMTWLCLEFCGDSEQMISEQMRQLEEVC